MPEVFGLSREPHPLACTEVQKLAASADFTGHLFFGLPLRALRGDAVAQHILGMMHLASFNVLLFVNQFYQTSVSVLRHVFDDSKAAKPSSS